MSGSLAVAGQRITAAWLNLNIPGPWQAMTLQNSWVNNGTGYVPAQYRLFNSVTLEIIGIIKSGVVTAGTVFATLPAGYLPSNEQGDVGAEWAPAATGNLFQVVFYPTGDLKLYSVSAGATALEFHSFFALDT